MTQNSESDWKKWGKTPMQIRIYGRKNKSLKCLNSILWGLKAFQKIRSGFSEP